MTSSKERLTPQGRYASAFETLGVKPEDGPLVLKAAYRHLMKTNHPDKGGDKIKAQRIIEAYRTGLEYYGPTEKKETILPEPPKTFGEKVNQRLKEMVQLSSNREEPKETKIFTFKPRTFETVKKEFEDSAVSYLKEKAVFVSSVTIPVEVFHDVFGYVNYRKPNIQKRCWHLYEQTGPSLKKINEALWYGHHILGRNEPPPLLLLDTAEVLTQAQTGEEMVANAVFCQAFMEWHLSLFQSLNGEDRDTVKHYGQIFKKLFLFFLTHQERKQNLDPLINAVKTARNFTAWNTDKKQARFETAKIFTLILQENEFTVEEMVEVLDQVYDIIGGNNLGGGGTRLVKNDWEVKFQPFIDHIRNLQQEEYSFPQIQSLLEIVAFIQGSFRTDIPKVQHISGLVSFVQRLEQVINKDWLQPQANEEKSAPAVDFVKTIMRSARGYLRADPNEYMSEWVEVLPQGLQVFSQQPGMFKSLMRALRELSIERDPSGKERSLSFYYGIKAPVKTCVYAAQKLPAYLNELFPDDPVLQEKKIMELQKLLRGYNESSYFSLRTHKHDDDNDLTGCQKEVYRFLASLQRREKKRGFLLPDDFDRLFQLF